MRDAPLMLCAGEALTDLLHQGEDRWVSRVGGSVWNVARALAALGEPTAFAGAVSRDHFGDALWRASEAAGLDLRLMQRVDRAPLLAVVERGEPPSYFFIGNDSADLHFDDRLEPIKPARAVAHDLDVGAAPLRFRSNGRSDCVGAERARRGVGRN